jgi:hypothetical protein
MTDRTTYNRERKRIARTRADIGLIPVEGWITPGFQAAWDDEQDRTSEMTGKALKAKGWD